MGILALAVMLLVPRQASPNLLDNGDFLAGASGWTLTPSVSVKGGILQVNNSYAPGTPYEVMASQRVAASAPAGLAGELTFEARSTTGAKIAAMLEKASDPYTKELYREINLTSTWTPYTISSSLANPIISGSHQVTFHMGLSKGQIEIRNVALRIAGAKTSRRAYPETLVDSAIQAYQEWTGGGSKPPFSDISQNNITAGINNVDGNPWDCQIGKLTNLPCSAGDVLHLKFRARSDKPISVSGVFELSEAPNSKAMYEPFRVEGDWKTYEVGLKAAESIPEGKSQFKFFFTGMGEIEITDVKLVNLGPNYPVSKLGYYAGKSTYERDEVWKKEADARIEKLRKGNLNLQILDTKGKPLANQLVTLKQTSHDFRFGVALTGSYMLNPSPDGVKYREVVKRLFNTVTFGNDLKWNGTNQATFDNLIFPAQKWLADNGIALRGHNLVWGSYKFSPVLKPEMSKEETWRQISEHVSDYTRKMKGKVYLWDVVNEAYSETEIWDKVGWDKFVEVHRLAKKGDPNALLCYNDYNISTNTVQRETAINRVKQIQAGGAPIDVFGDQSHLEPGAPSMRRMWEVWDEVHAKTKLPIEITEFDYSVRDDAMQAGYVEDYYRAAFSHPDVQAMIIWGFWENDHWKAAQGGHMVKADWTWRPAMNAIDRLINKDWKTSLSLKTDSKGFVRMRGFAGKYAVSVGGKSFGTKIDAGGLRTQSVKLPK
ncbi:MAG: endo-1,4-beta-xylanase [Armatimonadota bacterium]